MDQNPFTFGTVVKGESFYDREKECDLIIKTLIGGNNIVLYAPRRFGKTSLVLKIKELLEQRGYICIYLDFMNISSIDSFIRLYKKELEKKQNKFQKFVNTIQSIARHIRPVLRLGQDGSPRFSYDFDNVILDNTYISEILNLAESLAVKKKNRVFVFFDEFQEVKRLGGKEFEGHLRSVIQHQEKVNYLFLGSKNHMMQGMFNNGSSPFYKAAFQLTISSPPKEDTIKFLQTNFLKKNVTLNDKMGEYIINVTTNIPYYVQELAWAIWMEIESNSEISPEIIDTCVKQIVSNRRYYFQELFNNQSSSKQKLLNALSISAIDIFSEPYRQQYDLPNLPTMKRAEQGLINDGIIDKTDVEYFFTDPFFKCFLRNIASQP